MIRACIILPPKEFYGPGEAGGIALDVRSLLTRNEFVIGRRPHLQPFNKAQFIPIDSVSHRFFRRFHYIHKIIKVIKNIKPDYVEIHNKPNIARVLKQKLPSAHIGLVFHNDPCSMRQSKTPDERIQLSKSVHVVAKSLWIKDRYLSGIKTHPPVTVIPNAIDFFALPAPVLKEPIILFVGRLTPDKGIDSLVQVCKKLLPRFSHWRLVIIGADRFDLNAGHSSFSQELINKLNGFPVTWLGLQPYEDVMKWMMRASICVVPSRRSEPFGRTALEAMACKSALLTTYAGALPSIAGDAALYTDPNDITDFTRQLKCLMESPDLRKHLILKAEERSKKYDTNIVREQRITDIVSCCQGSLSDH